jgi:hypothetical protein
MATSVCALPRMCRHWQIRVIVEDDDSPRALTNRPWRPDGIGCDGVRHHDMPALRKA